MDDIHESEQPPVYHEWGEDWNLREVGRPPGLFMLVREYDEDDGSVTREVVAYGIAMPDGSATTVAPKDGGISGCWRSPESASQRTCSDLYWLGAAN